MIQFLHLTNLLEQVYKLLLFLPFDEVRNINWNVHTTLDHVLLKQINTGPVESWESYRRFVDNNPQCWEA